MSEERLVNIESQMAHQDQLMHELNDVVTLQAEKIMRLEELYNALTDRIRAIGEAVSNSGSEDDRPPHY